MSRRREIYPFMGAQLIGGRERPVLQPVLPIVIWGPDGSQGMRIEAAIVDTSADYCMCPSKVTRPIGYKIRTGKAITFGGAAAIGKAWRHFANIDILTHDYRAIFRRLSNVPLDSVQNRRPFPMLLGRIGFLDRFLIKIDFPNKILTLEVL